jgi:Dehydrogenases with different specificities (related to short-chain alcohol dehydrogenases)
MGFMDSFYLRGKVALLTGGGGGYGLQCAQALAYAGARTYLAARHSGPLEEVSARLRGEGCEVSTLSFDQGDDASILALRDEIAAREGRIDVLVNNAVARPMKMGFDDTAQAFEESMRVNATGLFLVTRAFGAMMMERGSGSIVNIASMMGMVGVEDRNYDGTEMSGWYPDYFFHKGGMINFTRFCASYYGRRGVRVNCVSPGGLRSPSHPERFVENYSARTQLGRLANDTDLMGAVVFLASDASAYVTGINLPVDGGYTAK